MVVADLLLQSSSSVSLLGALVVLLLVYIVSSSSFKNRKEPPGPKPLPLLGHLPSMVFRKPHTEFLELSKKYGSVFTIYLGPNKVVVLAGYKTVKAALVSHADVFGERTQWPVEQEINQGHGIIWSNGHSWKQMRQLALSHLRNFGIGKKMWEDKIIEECDCLIEVFKKFKGNAGQGFDTTPPIYDAVANIISSMVYGSRFEYGDPVFTSLVERTRRHMHLLFSTSMQMYNQFPWFYKLFARWTEFYRLGAANVKQTTELCRLLKETFDPHMCRGFVDAFLVRKQNLKESGITNQSFCNENLLVTVMNLFTAGLETTSGTLRWGLVFMAKYPKIQDQVQGELSRVIGHRQVRLEDRKNLPFTDACIHETLRLANTAPMSLPRRTSKDVTFQGYFIKKGTTVVPLLASVLNDESEWESPYSFNPAHFLDKDGKFVKRDAFIPFSAGRRSCPGETLARGMLFIFLTTLLQHFRFSPPAGVSEDELNPNSCLGLSLNPLFHEQPSAECEEGLKI
ncbi:cytochrome P450 2K1-like isoform 1-T1 [Acanthopagrus schlegelii]